MSIRSIAHSALRVADVDAAVAWYHDVLGFELLSPPFLMEGAEITRDMGELVPGPVAVKAAIVGFGGGADRVIELIEYPNVDVGTPDPRTVLDLGFTHVGLVCDDVTATRAALEAAGVRFIVGGIADVAGLLTTWFVDPWDNVFILVEKVRHPDAPYYRQYG